MLALLGETPSLETRVKVSHVLAEYASGIIQLRAFHPATATDRARACRTLLCLPVAIELANLLAAYFLFSPPAIFFAAYKLSDEHLTLLAFF